MLDIVSDFLEDLSPTQKDAVISTEGPLLILAGAGTGKTKVITTRIAYLIREQKAMPYEILALTFTNKAAKEMLDRIKNHTETSGMWFGTFHSICAKILRSHAELAGIKSDFNIIDADDQLKLVKTLMEEQGFDAKKYNPKAILNILQSWKDKALNPREVESNQTTTLGKMAQTIYPRYQERLVSSNLVDFGDLILYTINIFKHNEDVLKYYQNRFKYLHVDEYQDTNIAQYIFVRFLSEQHQNICVVGDDDQSIYGWRGADLGNILNFKSYFPNAKMVRLEQNYRSTQNILTAASVVISNNNNRLGKNLWTDGNEGEKIYVANLYNDLEEAEFFAKVIKHLSYNGTEYNQIAILVRAGFQTRSFEESFIKYSIPYKVVGNLKFYERQEIKDAISYMRLLVNNNDDLALERIINVPKRSIGSATLKQIRNFAMLSGTSLFEAIIDMLKNKIFPTKTSSSLENFTSMILSWKDLLEGNIDNGELLQKILEDSGYIEMWKQDKSPGSASRIDNLKELSRAISEFNSIKEFLEHVSLVSSSDDITNENTVSIMTLHAAKGLEFDTVILPGWEEGIFPSLRGDFDTDKDIEEERRLAYVGITRARKKLFISFVNRRRIYNSYQDSNPSRFILELPKAICQPLNFNSILTPEIFLGKPDNITEKFQILKPKKEQSIEQSTDFSKGKKVFHNKFGYGKILAIESNNIHVMFEYHGLKNVKKEFLQIS